MKMPKIIRHVPWARNFFFKHMCVESKKILAEVETIKQKDRAHWGDKRKRQISTEMITAFVCHGNWVHEILPRE